jgi:hypothetical protein
MNVHLRPVAAALVAIPLLALAATAPPARGKGRGGAPDARLVARGEYLVRITGCNDCHTPYRFDEKLGMPVPDLSRMLSGHPEGAPDPVAAYAKPDIGVIGPTFTSFALPFGVVYASNITSDPETGIGAWSEELFIDAMRTGRRGGGKGDPLLPPMPWMNLAGATDEDLRAIFAYLRSTPPVRNRVPDPKVPAEAKQHVGEAWDQLLLAQPARPKRKP